MIPVNTPLLAGNEEKYLRECIRTGWISSEGEFVRRLEQGMAERVGRKHGVAVCNGSAALDAAVAALQLGPGDEVILPAHTFVSSAAPFARTGATLRWADIEPDTRLISAESIGSLDAAVRGSDVSRARESGLNTPG